MYPRLQSSLPTDQQTTDRGTFRNMRDASSGIKYQKVTVYSLGIGKNVDQQQLEDIASSSSKVFVAESFKTLAPYAQTIVQNSCPDACEIFPCKAPHNIGCRVVDDESECICPSCPASSSPVCATDDVQDISECFTKRQACLTSTPINIATRAPCVPDCRKAADIAFIVDSSGSIGKTNWERTKRFLKRMVNKLDIGMSTTHVAVITYSNNPQTILRFDTLQGSSLSVAGVNNVLDGLQWQRGKTYIDKALDAAVNVFTTGRGMRTNVPKMAFVITDGKQTKTGSYTPLRRAADPLRRKGVQLVAIGVGNRNAVDTRELLEIAGQNNYVYLIESFEELQNPGQARIFRQRICQGKNQVFYASFNVSFSQMTAWPLAAGAYIRFL
ncbi:collagen alpha-6(VI) chain-like isoform X2 [Stylophora pistillata]|uniref:collagen alpha-6(VI) chain-like isoform X2 n=1 Tax=Stylophora pistillata TaxID=50429 RepID=UPI000C0547AA|nr:collagen alpha-6(VI) chain-like isoform X2 [Stylophora pistillata]